MFAIHDANLFALSVFLSRPAPPFALALALFAVLLYCVRACVRACVHTRRLTYPLLPNTNRAYVWAAQILCASCQKDSFGAWMGGLWPLGACIYQVQVARYGHRRLDA
jgi:hypothetical protein